MSVLTYLQETSSAVRIADWERTSIDTSISTLSTKLGNYFDNLDSRFVFGSYDRKTILRRSKDSNSDVDYMVVFNDGSEYKPQTLMTRLKSFAESNYSKNEIYQSSPTIVLELSNIKFEIAPAYKSWFTLYIPAPASNYSDWISTDPNKIKTDLDNKHRDNNYLIKDLILILKYWNAKNDRVYSSFELERYIIDKWYFFCSNLKDYFYSAVSGLPTGNLPAYKATKVEGFKQIVTNTKNFESNDMPASAELEIKKAI